MPPENGQSQWSGAWRISVGDEGSVGDGGLVQIPRQGQMLLRQRVRPETAYAGGAGIGAKAGFRNGGTA